MGKVMIINASPRAPKSNSKQYAQLFSEYCRLDTEYCEVKKSNHLTLCQMIENYSDIVFVFPLYADSIPVTFLNFLKALEENVPLKKPTISVVINCGFIEPYQNDIAVKMLQLFAKKKWLSFWFRTQNWERRGNFDNTFSYFFESENEKICHLHRKTEIQ